MQLSINKGADRALDTELCVERRFRSVLEERE